MVNNMTDEEIQEAYKKIMGKNHVPTKRREEEADWSKTYKKVSRLKETNTSYSNSSTGVLNFA